MDVPSADTARSKAVTPTATAIYIAPGRRRLSMRLVSVRGEGEVMSRYIEVDDAVKVMACEMYAEAQSQGYDVDGIEDFMPEAKAWLNDAPSIDIVRCQDCKYWNTDGCREGVGECTWAYYMTKPDDFCSYGERREP